MLRLVAMRTKLLAAVITTLTGCSVGSLSEEEKQAFLNFDTGTSTTADAGDGGSLDTGPTLPAECTEGDVVAVHISNVTACASSGCHGGGQNDSPPNLARPDILSLLANETATNCMGRPYVNLSDPANSVLVEKVTVPAAGCGTKMPFAGLGEDLTAAEVSCLEALIAEAGAGSADAGVQDSGNMDAGSMDMGGNDGFQLDMAVEAESAMLVGGFTMESDNEALGGTYVVRADGNSITNPANAEANQVVFNFELDSGGEVYIWARARVPATNNDSFFVRVNDSDWVQYNGLGTNGVLGLDTWGWDDVHDSNGDDSVPQPYTVQAGMNTLRFSSREPLAELDAFIITRDANFNPPQ